MESKFEVGKTYILHDSGSSAHFRAKVTKRTKCKVTFELSDTGKNWCNTEKPVTLTVKKDANVWGLVGYDEEVRLEYVCGTAKGQHWNRKLWSESDMEANRQM